jgi:quercetin dioxygenase-like cupin family protein
MARLLLRVVAPASIACLTLAGVALSDQSDARPAAVAVPAGAGAQAASVEAAASPHHQVILPDKIDWKDGPRSLPAGAKFVVLEGDPAKAGFFAMRARLPDGFRVPPHFHPGVERITVLSGTFHLGSGETFDKSAATALPPGSYSSMQPGMRHFGWAQGETIIQVATEGPCGITYVNPDDDPRRGK